MYRFWIESWDLDNESWVPHAGYETRKAAKLVLRRISCGAPVNYRLVEVLATAENGEVDLVRKEAAR